MPLWDILSFLKSSFFVFGAHCADCIVDKVRDFLSEIDIYALISGMDLGPRTLNEAQLMKKPIVASNVGGIPELIKDGETGFLVEEGNVED